MPTRNQSGKPEHVHQNLNRKRKKSWNKYKNLIKQYRLLKKRESNQEATWDAKWILNDLKRIESQRIKMWLTVEQMNS
jgi:hypothetical protein